MTEDLDLPGTVRVVLVDANVLYSRVLRDYLLYAADEEDHRDHVEPGDS